MPKGGIPATQAPERHLDSASLRNSVSVIFLGNGWREIRPVIVTVQISTEAKGTPLLFEGLELLSGKIEHMLKSLSFRTLGFLVNCIAPIAQSDNYELLRIVGQTPTAVPRAEEGLTRILNFTRMLPQQRTKHNRGWVLSSHERLIRSLKVSCNIGPASHETNGRQILSLHIRIIGDLEAGAPRSSSPESAELWCRLAKRVCETAEQDVYASAEMLIGSILMFLLVQYPVSKVGVACERLSPLPGLPFVEGEVIEIIRDRRSLGVAYVGEQYVTHYTMADIRLAPM